MARPTSALRKYGTTAPKQTDNRSNIRKAGQKNTYSEQSDTHGTQKNPAASWKHKGAPVKKIGTPFKFHDVQTPPAGW
jgi:hypothetical protein